MPLTLPPIPDEAIDAVIGPTTAAPGDRLRAAIRVDLTAAWPHLYRAALRHAATDGLGKYIRTPPGVTPSGFTKGLMAASDELLHLADQAVEP